MLTILKKPFVNNHTGKAYDKIFGFARILLISLWIITLFILFFVIKYWKSVDKLNPFLDKSDSNKEVTIDEKLLTPGELGKNTALININLNMKSVSTPQLSGEAQSLNDEARKVVYKKILQQKITEKLSNNEKPRDQDFSIKPVPE